ncbi:MAG TPA: hypothetical protein VNZ64_03945 [Candidatus Acidoferrum sp.]|nr:hypothetical protein [Candidatus Acidoferrum sp.]
MHDAAHVAPDNQWFGERLDMDRDYADAHYSSLFVEDRKQGMAGLELHRACAGQKARVARILFWDASGQFSVETFNYEVPLDLLEELITEVRTLVKTK